MSDSTKVGSSGTVPGRTLTSLLLSEPAMRPDGTLNTWFAQWCMRLSQFVGPVQSGQTGSLSEQVSVLANETDISGPGGGASIPAAAASQIAALQGAAARMPPPYPPPNVYAKPQVQPLAALQPWLTSASMTSTVTGIYAPLVSGVTPGPNLIADPSGQTVMVQIR